MVVINKLQDESENLPRCRRAATVRSRRRGTSRFPLAGQLPLTIRLTPDHHTQELQGPASQVPITPKACPARSTWAWKSRNQRACDGEGTTTLPLDIHICRDLPRSSNYLSSQRAYVLLLPASIHAPYIILCLSKPVASSSLE